MTELSIVFIHGVGKAQPRERWLDPLVHSLAGLGLPRPDRGLDRIVEPNYVKQMELRAESESPPVTWRQPEGSIHEANALAFAVEADRLAGAVLDIRNTERGVRPVPGWSTGSRRRYGRHARHCWLRWTATRGWQDQGVGTAGGVSGDADGRANDCHRVQPRKRDPVDLLRRLHVVTSPSSCW